MAEHGPQLVNIGKTLVAAATSLLTHMTEILEAINETFPPDEEPADLSASVNEDTTDTTHMTAQLVWDNTGEGPVKIDWGVTDVTDDEEPETGTLTYQYQESGTYPVQVTDQDDETRFVRIPVTVPFTTTGA